MSCQHCRGNPDRINAPPEGDWGPDGCQGDPSPGDHPEPLGEPANIRTELAQLKADFCLVGEMVMRLADYKDVHARALTMLDIRLRAVNSKLDAIEKHTDGSSNSK